MYRDFASRRPLAQTSFFATTKPALSELVESIRKWARRLSSLLVATGIFSILTALIVSIGTDPAAPEESLLFGLGVVVFGGLQLWLAKKSAHYADALDHYLQSGDPERWVEVFVRQRQLVVGVAVGGAFLLAVFSVGFLIVVVELLK